MAHPILGFSRYQANYTYVIGATLVAWFLMGLIANIFPLLTIVSWLLLVLTIPYFLLIVVRLADSMKLPMLAERCFQFALALDFMLCNIPYNPYSPGLFDHVYQYQRRLRLQKRYREAEQILERGIIYLQQQFLAGGAYVVLLQCSMVELLLKQDKATNEYIEAIALTMGQLLATDSDVAAAVLAMSVSLVRKGRYLEAQTITARIAELIDTGVISVTDRNRSFYLLLHLGFLSKALKDCGQMAGALDICKLQLAWSEKIYGVGARATANYHCNLGFELAQCDNFVDANKHLDFAYSLIDIKSAGAQTMRCILLNKRGEVQRLEGRLEEAKASLEESLGITTVPHYRPETLLYLARVYVDRGDINNAKSYFNQTIDSIEALAIQTPDGKRLFVGDIKLADVLLEYTQFLRRMNQSVEAEKLEARMQLLMFGGS